MIKKPSIKDVEWKVIDPAFDWVKYNLTVIGNGYTPDGQRYHLVQEGDYNGEYISNAYIFTGNIEQIHDEVLVEVDR